MRPDEKKSLHHENACKHPWSCSPVNTPHSQRSKFAVASEKQRRRQQKKACTHVCILRTYCQISVAIACEEQRRRQPKQQQGQQIQHYARPFCPFRHLHVPRPAVACHQPPPRPHGELEGLPCPYGPLRRRRSEAERGRGAGQGQPSHLPHDVPPCVWEKDEETEKGTEKGTEKETEKEREYSSAGQTQVGADNVSAKKKRARKIFFAGHQPSGLSGNHKMHYICIFFLLFLCRFSLIPQTRVRPVLANKLANNPTAESPRQQQQVVRPNSSCRSMARRKYSRHSRTSSPANPTRVTALSLVVATAYSCPGETASPCRSRKRGEKSKKKMNTR